jgi:hypothetical protein
VATNLRGTRSASALIGTDPRKKRMPKAPPITPSVPREMPSELRMSGASTASAVESNTSMKLRSPMIPAVRTPFSRNACRSDTGSEPTPGSMSSGSTTGSRSPCVSRRRVSSSSTDAASAAGAAS